MTPTKFLGLLLVVVYIVALKVLAGLDLRTVFEPPLLLLILNALFVGIIPIGVAYIAGRSYLQDGSVTVLLMGCGMLSFGLGAISAGLLIQASNGANFSVTLYNAGAFCGSLFHAVGALLGLVGTGYSDDTRRRKVQVMVAYTGLLAVTIVFSLAVLRDLVPAFFIQGVGPTDLRQAILGTSVLMFFVSSASLMAYYFKSKSDFLYWYALCLAMLCIGLFAVFIQRSVGGPLGWLGRSASYFGGVYALVAVLGAWRDARVKGVALERTVADGFREGEAGYWRGLLPVMPIPIFIIVLVILVSTDIRTVFEPSGLYAALNILFLTIFPLTVAYFATRGYLQSGLFSMLMLGSGTLTLGLGSALSGWLLPWPNVGPNASVTIIVLCFLFSAIFHLLGGIAGIIGLHPKKDTRHKDLIVAFTYIGIAVLMALLTNMILKDLIPAFFIQGQGYTRLRDAVEGTATILFSISGLLLLSLYLLSRTKLLYWYSLALFLLTTGLICHLCGKSVGDPIAWLCRIALYLSGIYLLIGVTSAAKDFRTKGASQEEGIANLFRHHLESLVEERTLQLFRAKEELQAAHNELECANAELEERVLDRTAELKNANERLEEEIEERKQIERSLRQSESKYKALYEGSADGIFLSDYCGTILDINEAAVKMYGYPLEEIRGTKVVNLIHPEDLKAVPFKLQEIIEGTIRFMVRRMRKKDGTYLTVEATAASITHNLIQVIYRDITERKQMQDLLVSRAQELATANEDLRRSNEDLQQFAYVASHDLQEPLRNVASCLQMLEKDYKNKLDANADQYIHYAVDSAVRMKALILDLLEYSRVTTKGNPPIRVDCEQTLDRTLNNLGAAIFEAGAVITHDPLPTVLADDTQLLQVFQNLMGNAIKFRRDDPPRIHVSAVMNKNEWIFSVKDDGIGIESQHLDRIFVIFQRLHKRSEYEGTGMGLAIVKKVVERHAGRVWVESEPGVGTTFYFAMPERGVKA